MLFRKWRAIHRDKKCRETGSKKDEREVKRGNRQKWWEKGMDEEHEKVIETSSKGRRRQGEA